MNNKQFKTLDEQIAIMEHKGMMINNKDQAKEVLLRENYFFLNGYRHIFLKSAADKKALVTFLTKLFIKKTSFQIIMFIRH